MLKQKEIALWMSGAIGFLIPALFAWNIYTTPAIHPNTATWLMVLFMDVVGLWMAYVGDNERPYMQIGWVCAAVCIVTAILLRKGTWSWNSVETASLILCLLAIILWQAFAKKGMGKRGMLIGLMFQSMAVYVSFIPQMVDYWKRPEPTTWYLWFFSAVGCLLAIYAAPKRDAAHTFIPWAGTALNIGIFALIFK